MKLKAEKLISKSLGLIHFIGIGGIGMSGIAEILHNLGYRVQGSDANANSNTSRLEALGLKVFVGHRAENVEGVGLIIRSSAVGNTNPEIVAANAHHIPVISRADMLAELMRLKISVAIAGTHGKTTTTSLVATLFESAGLAPTVINGGIINTHGTNAYLGSGDFLIAEADESDGTFIKVPSTIAVITNIDPEHLDYYGSFEKLKLAFRSFVENLPFYGFAVLCNDHPEVAALATSITDRRVITYGLDSEADIRATNIKVEDGGSSFTVTVKAQPNRPAKTLPRCFLPIPGRHNVSNALSAIAIALELGFPDDIIMNGFEKFKGVKRRFTKTGEVNGVHIIDDYAHHPKEIEATLRTAVSLTKPQQRKVVAVVQPHRYTRLKDLFEDFVHCFEECSTIIMLPLYTAGETPIEGITSQALADAIIRAYPDKSVTYLADPKDLAVCVAKQVKAGDIVLCMGAGSITQMAYALPDQLQKALIS